MNLFEAKRIAEKHGFKVVKKEIKDAMEVARKAGYKVIDESKKGDDVPPWAKLSEAKRVVKAAGYKVIGESKKGDDVPPWAKLNEAKCVARKAGYKVIKEGYGDVDGTLFTNICQSYLENNAEKLNELIKSVGIQGAIADILEQIAECIGHGVSEEYYTRFADRLKRSRTVPIIMKTLSNAMLAGDGLATI